MALKSRLFSGNKALEAAATSNPAHIVQGARGEHVSKIQGALQALDNAKIAPADLSGRIYGKSTADAVLAYKRKRDIVNRSYQQTADNIAGIMTVTRMDQELAALESRTRYTPVPTACGRGRQVTAPDAGQYDQYVMPMSDAQMIAVLQGGTSPESRALVAKLEGGGNGPLIAGRNPGPAPIRRG